MTLEQIKTLSDRVIVASGTADTLEDTQEAAEDALKACGSSTTFRPSNGDSCP